ncbi:TonB-dependent siderophore receptor [Nostoc sp. UCD121]|uniref:TonB-dependent siderophore receptor n=1 Tax=unclassified Nostoc TaxID=2593658 RepID=UPI001628CBBE|nr:MULTISPECIES: TonB-dependent siderophore receptor [unclassified Nostoc]MBC1220820.1 TonB-dependent siderophore receptor [Nostoc sp. UCD120]MBC1280416.1 TonB-dependent siderophore receptor [Nostoc sp. UCD121]MBC1297503.1 TonB-dependent siderophore receptor [Nostoc sp. UCD122]
MLNLWQTSLFLTGIFFLVEIQATWAETADSNRSAQILVQSPTSTSEIIPVTGVKANPTEKGVEIIFQTSKGEQLQITNSSTGNNFIADIPNAQLRLPNGDGFTFRSEKPVVGITEITVTNFDAQTIRITVVGENSLPAVELFDDNEGLIFGVTSSAIAAQPQPEKPASETPQEQPAAQQDDQIELVVTGEEDGYRVQETTTGTKTDTPLRDIPQSIQVVPQQVLRDQQVTRLDDALRNVPGVNQNFNFGPFTFYSIRGFDATETNLLRDGLIDTLAGQVSELSSIERVEVLKGPASVLFGLGNPGGSINLISKRPLSEPFYTIDATIGSYSFYRGAVDLSGALNDSKTVLYRLNLAYRNSGSSVDFFDGESLNISPVISVAIGEKTNLSLEAEYIKTSDRYASGVPVIGSLLPNPNGKVSRNLNLIEPSDKIEQTITRLGYRIDHKFNENWSLNNAFSFAFRDLDQRRTDSRGLEPDNRTWLRSFSESSSENRNYAMSTNLIGKFATGSIQHQLLFGFDLNRFDNFNPVIPSFEAASIDIFNPVYGNPRGANIISSEGFRQQTNSLGIYLQDQVALTDNLKVLLGGRFDVIDRKYEDLVSNTESSGTDSAFSPRFGIVYQPIPAISLYTSYTSSFTPPGGSYFFGVDSSFKPERGNQYEAGVKADLNDRLSATLALFDLTRTNVTTEDPNRPNFSIQVGEQNSRGVELNLAGEILPGWNIFAGYAYIDARITKDNTLTPGNRLSNSANNSFNLWTSYEIQKGNLQGLGAGIGLFFVGDRANFGNTYTVPSYLRTDAAIFYNRDRFRVALNFKNLFDIDYFESSLGNRVYYGQPFTVQGTVSWHF